MHPEAEMEQKKNLKEQIAYVREYLQIVEEIEKFFPNPFPLKVTVLGRETLEYLEAYQQGHDPKGELVGKLDEVARIFVEGHDGILPYTWGNLIDLCRGSLSLVQTFTENRRSADSPTD